MYTISPKQAHDEILGCIMAGLTPLLSSSPGMGKSALVNQIAKEYHLKLIDLRLSQCTPEDLQGFPMRQGNKAVFTPFDVFPLEGDEIPEGYDGWLLFLDELTSATKPVQAAAYKLILDRMTGSFKLHDNVAIVAAGNKVTDKAVVSQMSTALQSRMIHFELEVSSDEWIEFAYGAGIDHRIISYIGYSPSKLMDFRPDHQEKTFPCPRTWEFLSKLVKDKEINANSGPRIAGTIGEGCATEFITFAREFDRLPKYPAIVAAPGTTQVPGEVSTKYATMGMLVENFHEDDIEPVIEYVRRFDIEMQILFCKGAVIRNPAMRDGNAAFKKYLQDMIRYIQ